MDDDQKNLYTEINNKLCKLEQHLINLIVPLQHMAHILKSTDYYERLKILKNEPVKIDDRKLAVLFNDFLKKMDNYKKIITENENTLNEIRFIGKKVNDIDKSLKKIVEEGLIKKVQLSFQCDGYELVQKTKGYDLDDLIEPPIDSEKNTLELLQTLDERERLTLVYVYGLCGQDKKKPKEIAKMFGIKTIARIGQIKQKALTKCRHKSRNKFVKHLDNEKLKNDIGVREFD